jgi:hypothetical protein
MANLLSIDTRYSIVLSVLCTNTTKKTIGTYCKKITNVYWWRSIDGNTHTINCENIVLIVTLGTHSPYNNSKLINISEFICYYPEFT